MKMQVAEFDVLSWDDEWNTLVSDIHVADHQLHQWDGENMSEFNRLEKASDRAQGKYEKYVIEYPICRLHAERLIDNLKAKVPKHEFAAHEDVSDGGWVLLARRPATNKPPTPKQWDELSLVAEKIREAVEKKYPSEKSKPRPARVQTKKSTGCLMLVLLIPLAIVGIHYIVIS